MIEFTPHKSTSLHIDQNSVGVSDTIVNIPIPATIVVRSTGGVAVLGGKTF